MKSYFERLEKHFEAGKIIPSYAGQDRVIKFEANLKGWPTWKVTVQAVDETGKPIGPQRWHCTHPHEPF